MAYLKLIAVNIGDFESTIEFEEHYSLADNKLANERKSNLEKQGYYCMLVNVDSNIEI